MRYINVENLLEKLDMLFHETDESSGSMNTAHIHYNHGVSDAIAIIKNMPSPHCATCKHSEISTARLFDTYACKIKRRTYEPDFCCIGWEEAKDEAD